ncbi:Uncharacterised protein [uncultured archaeon]|nr:Uncharacterised protein [uncultured archaeon]
MAIAQGDDGLRQKTVRAEEWTAISGVLGASAREHLVAYTEARADDAKSTALRRLVPEVASAIEFGIQVPAAYNSFRDALCRTGGDPIVGAPVAAAPYRPQLLPVDSVAGASPPLWSAYGEIELSLMTKIVEAPENLGGAERKADREQCVAALRDHPENRILQLQYRGITVPARFKGEVPIF